MVGGSFDPPTHYSTKYFIMILPTILSEISNTDHGNNSAVISILGSLLKFLCSCVEKHVLQSELGSETREQCYCKHYITHLLGQIIMLPDASDISSH